MPILAGSYAPRKKRDGWDPEYSNRFSVAYCNPVVVITIGHGPQFLSGLLNLGQWLKALCQLENSFCLLGSEKIT